MTQSGLFSAEAIAAGALVVGALISAAIAATAELVSGIRLSAAERSWKPAASADVADGAKDADGRTGGGSNAS